LRLLPGSQRIRKQWTLPYQAPSLHGGPRPAPEWVS
jgi:hypothetical protein